MINKLKSIIQWFMLLDLVEHGHWCFCNRYDQKEKRINCPYEGYRWMCKGLFCADVNKKDCPTCVNYENNLSKTTNTQDS